MTMLLTAGLVPLLASMFAGLQVDLRGASPHPAVEEEVSDAVSLLEEPPLARPPSTAGEALARPTLARTGEVAVEGHLASTRSEASPMGLAQGEDAGSPSTAPGTPPTGGAASSRPVGGVKPDLAGPGAFPPPEAELTEGRDPPPAAPEGEDAGTVAPGSSRAPSAQREKAAPSPPAPEVDSEAVTTTSRRLPELLLHEV